jgi:hypothetical protein
MLVLAAAFALAAAATPAPSVSVYGVYNTGRSEIDAAETGTMDVELHPCTDDLVKLCGTIRVLRDQSDPEAPTVMPDGAPIVGFTMIEGLEPRAPGKWRGGRINAVDESLDEGKMAWYGVKLDAKEENAVTITGCLGFVCPRKIVWRRVDIEPAPEPAPAPAGE